MTQNMLLRSIVYPSLLVLSLRDIALVTGLTTLVIWAICRAFPKLPPNVRCWLWRLALLRYVIWLFVPFTIPLTTAHHAPVFTPFNTIRVPSVVAIPAAAIAATPERPLPPSAAAPPPNVRTEAKDQPANASAAVPVSQVTIALPQVSHAFSRTSVNPYASPPLPKFWLDPQLTILSLQILAGLYLLGVAMCAVRVATRGIRTRRFLARECRPIVDTYLQSESIELSRRLGILTPPAILETAAASSSMLLARLRPVVVLPIVGHGAGDRDAQRLMLAHELTHLRRRDLWWSWLGTIAHTLFFFHPLVWLARHEEALACEMACDARTVQLTESVPAAYGALLVKLTTAGHGPNLTALGIAHEVKGIRQRLIALKQTGDIVRQQRRLIGTAFAVALVAALPWRAFPRMIYFRPPDVQPATVRGRVVRMPDGTSGVNCSVLLRSVGATPPNFRRGICDVDGNFTIPQIDPGRYRVSTARMSPSYGDRIIDIAPGARITLPPIPLINGVEVFGKVVDFKTGCAMSDVEIAAGNADDGVSGASFWMPATSDGKFTVLVVPGRVAIYLRHRMKSYQAEGLVLPAQYTVPDSQGTGRSVFTIGENQPRQIVLNVLGVAIPAPIGSIPPITGHVVDSHGLPVAGAEIYLGSIDSSIPGGQPGIRTDSLGRFAIRGLSPRWRGVSCELQARDTVGNRVSFAMPLVIPKSGAPAPVTISLAPGVSCSVFGRVVDTNGRPVSGAKVSLLAWSGRLTLQEAVLTDAAGRYAFNGLWPDLLARVEVEREGYGETVGSIRGDIPLKTGEHHLVASHILEPATKTLTGIYVSSHGAALPGVMFSGVRGDSIVGNGFTDDQGRFRLDRLTPGPLRLYFNHSAHWVAAKAGDKDLRVVQN